jgi:hypothetical protein
MVCRICRTSRCGRRTEPGPEQCIALKTPIIFAEGAAADNAYVGSLYEQVSFLGDLNRQLSQLPDGSKVQLRTQE